MEHPSKEIIGTEGEELRGKKIILGITGSVSAYLAPDIARSLMRHGADVHAVMTAAAQKIIHPDLMEWATGNPVVTELTGKIEHVVHTTGAGKADAILIAPATANTIGKIAAGIDDSPVTSYVSSALGAGIPILIAPAMHDTMMRHPIIQENLKKLERVGVVIIPPTIDEGKAKLASVEEILSSLILTVSNKDMRSMKVLITGGPTAEQIDPVRVLTNRSSGKMAVALASAAERRGASVTLVYGPGSAEPPIGVKVLAVNTAEQMYKQVISQLSHSKYHLMLAAAAVSDYRPVKILNTKIESSKSQTLTLELARTPKIIDQAKRVSPSTFLVIFKAEHNLPRAELLGRARQRLRESGADMVVVNDVGREGIGFGADENEVTVVSSGGETTHLSRAPKRRIADGILSLAVRELRSE
ncbi:MAG: bifunctional phosphopantothenoylcysteine decarboxylase/phosphopantothenate--cysteine ligase CoaBC [Nitrososphaerales archaeon]|nr:bifunctional phosphopantothenoylcysteine decarboxylase/phosphopantothenate--cysteine ligase CoaBC [Nitrososphaerales archaeon]